MTKDIASTSAARHFYGQYPASFRSMQDYLRSAPPAAALEALFAGVFDGDASTSGLSPYIVDQPDATTVPDLGLVGCVLGYKSKVAEQTDQSEMDSSSLPSSLGRRRQWPAMHCDEPWVSDPITTAWAEEPTFYGTGCVPNDSCERQEPCADEDGGEFQQTHRYWFCH